MRRRVPFTLSFLDVTHVLTLEKWVDHGEEKEEREEEDKEDDREEIDKEDENEDEEEARKQ